MSESPGGLVFVFVYLSGLGLRCCMGCSRGELGLLSSGTQASHQGGFFRCRARGSRAWASVAAAPRLTNTGSVVAVHRLSCSVACGIFPDQGWNPPVLYWQVNSLPLSHQGGLGGLVEGQIQE